MELSGARVAVDTAPTLGNPINNNFNNFEINNSSNIIVNTDSIDSTTNENNYEQAAPPLGEEQDLATTMNSPTESKPATVELVIGTWNIQSGRNTRLETAL